MANKKTVVQMYEEILAIPTLTDEQKSFIEKRIELTQKKNASKPAEPTPKQREKIEADNAIKENVLAVMTAGTQYTPSDLLKMVENVSSTQKLTPLLTALVDDGKVVREMVKGRNVYSLPKVETATES